MDLTVGDMFTQPGTGVGIDRVFGAVLVAERDDCRVVVDYRVDRGGVPVLADGASVEDPDFVASGSGWTDSTGAPDSWSSQISSTPSTLPVYWGHSPLTSKPKSRSASLIPVTNISSGGPARQAGGVEFPARERPHGWALAEVGVGGSLTSRADVMEVLSRHCWSTGDPHR